MKAKSLLWTVGRLLIGGLIFVGGSILGGMVATLLGIPVPLMPGEIDPAKAGESMPLVGVLMAGVLAILSKQTGVHFLPRWIVLGLFSWTVYGLNNYLEARFFTPSMATAYVLVMNFCACFAVSAVVAWLFKPAMPLEPFFPKCLAFVKARPASSWAWRLLGGLAAFPAAYFLFGWLVAPFVVSYYQQQYAGLALPTLEVMLVLASVRSLLFLLTVLPVLMAWKGSRISLFLALGGALFAMVGGLNMLQAIWLPGSLRAAHSLEILADSFAHAAALVSLLVPGAHVGRLVPTMANNVEAR